VHAQGVGLERRAPQLEQLRGERVHVALADEQAGALVLDLLGMPAWRVATMARPAAEPS